MLLDSCSEKREKFSDSSDHCNPNAKLPRWKGVLASYDTPLQSSVPVSVQLGKKPVIDDDSNHKDCKLFPLKFSDVVKLPPREIKMTAQNGNVGDGPVSILSSGDRKTISGKELVSGIDISLRIDAIHKLSKLLLYHCSNGTCELSEQDGKSLEQVICNLDKCISTNIGQELYSDRRQMDAIDAPSQKPEEKMKQSDEKNERISASVSVKNGLDTGVKMDKEVQIFLQTHRMRMKNRVPVMRN